MRTIWGVAAMKACQWASMSPGISTLPRPSITVTFGIVLASMGAVETRSMMFPLTNTLEGGESAAFLPSKTRTLRNSVAFSTAVGCCAWMATQTPSATATPAANLICAIVFFDAVEEERAYFICFCWLGQRDDGSL